MDTAAAQIMLDEGIRLRVYKDSLGHASIGYGRCLETCGISMDEADYLLHNDIKRCRNELSSCPWYLVQSDSVKDALVNMCFNLGFKDLLEFDGMIAALMSRNYELAAKEALDSAWAREVGERAQRIAMVFRNAAKN